MWGHLFWLFGQVWSMTWVLTGLVLRAICWAGGLVPLHVYGLAFLFVLVLCKMRPHVAAFGVATVFAYVSVAVAMGIGAIAVFACLFIVLLFLLAWVPHTLLLVPAIWTLDGSWLPYGGWAYLQHTLVLLVLLAWAIVCDKSAGEASEAERWERRELAGHAPATERPEVQEEPRATRPTTWTTGRGLKPFVLPSIPLKPAMRPGMRADTVEPMPTRPVSIAWATVNQVLRNYTPESPRGERGGQSCGDNNSSSEFLDAQS